MRIVFMGTPRFAVPTLQKLGPAVVGVVTQPDRPRGRGYRLQPSAVKQAAAAAGIPLLQPQQVNDQTALAEITNLSPDLIVVVAFGQILSAKLLALPPLGCINLHASLLPRWRGAAPIERAIMNGDAVTGVTTMYMSTGLDTGDIIMQEKEEIRPDDTAGTLAVRLAQKGAHLVQDTVKAIATGTAPRHPQDDALASWAPPLGKKDEILNWRLPARQIADQIRALNPAPGAVTFVAEKRLKIWQARVIDGGLSGEPGQVLEIRTDGLVIACGAQDAVLIHEVQPAGKRSMPARAYACGYHVRPGDVWG
ncbi:MAG: methionyl-tRNA formyltransferase [Firmicutes bacterium]|nr:methionyl-tRNA formyltransferase [Bacillota bacterium]